MKIYKVKTADGTPLGRVRAKSAEDAIAQIRHKNGGWLNGVELIAEEVK